MTDDAALGQRAELSDLLGQVWEDLSAKRRLAAFVARQAGVAESEITASLATGGTKQMRNRLSQAEIRNAKQLSVFLLDQARLVEPCVEYLIDATRGRRSAQPPAGPVALAFKESDGAWIVAAVVAPRPTRASRFVAELFDARLVDPTDWVEPVLPAGARLWLLMSMSPEETTYADIDGVRYHFPVHIPNGRQIAVGDVVATARFPSSKAADAGHIFGIGRVGRRVESGTSAYVYFDRFASLDPPMDLEAYGDPRNNMNAMWAVTAEWMRGLVKFLAVDAIDDLPVPFTVLTVEQVETELRARRLVFPEALLERTIAALRASKHVMFTGPPGTGKTSLALAVATAAAQVGLCEQPMLTTATSDWTSADTVGAYRLTRAQDLRFHAGQVVAAIEQNRWLVVDELNRADIDKAIGQLFTVLSGQPVLLPFEDQREDDALPIAIVPPGEALPEGSSPRVVPSHWRLLATLNDRDRDLLFDLSEALMRRFAIIEVGPPDPATWTEIFRVCGGTGRRSWDAALLHLVTSELLAPRPVGAAVVLDCVRHLVEVARLSEERATPLREVEALQDALDLYIKPQLRTIASEVAVDATTLLAATASAVVQPSADGDPAPETTA